MDSNASTSVQARHKRVGLRIGTFSMASATSIPNIQTGCLRTRHWRLRCGGGQMGLGSSPKTIVLHDGEQTDPLVNPPKGCHIAAWNWLDRTDGFLECQEGHAYLYKDAVMTVALGSIPRSCRLGMATVVRTGGDLFASCSEQGQVWRLRAGTSRWALVPGISHVASLQARNGCLLVGTKRAVYRRCETP